MDLDIVIVKIVGVILLGWTIYSIYKNFKEKKDGKVDPQMEKQSNLEAMLNNVLLYVWLAFMLTFSSGMILNN